MDLMQSLIIIFLIVIIGYVCGKKKLFSDVHTDGFELFLFKIAIPCYLFSAILTHNFSSLINVQYIYCYIASFMVICLITVMYFWRDNQISDICIRVLATGYVNAAIYTIPVITFLMQDPKAAILGNLIQVIIIQSILLIILNFITHKNKSVMIKLFTSISNPLVALPMLGILLRYFNINAPDIVTKVFQSLGQGASGMALFIFGLSMSHTKMNQNIISIDLIFIILSKNILHPLIAFILGNYLFQLDKYWLSSMVIAASAPTAFVVYIIAKQYSTEPLFVKRIVAISSIISLILLVFIARLVSSIE